MTNPGTAIAGRVREAAEAAGLTAHGLAERSGIPYKTLWRRLNITPDHFKVDELLAIAHVTGASWTYLAAGVEDSEDAA